MAEEKQGLFVKWKQGMQKTRANFAEKMEWLTRAFQKIDEAYYEELEEILIMADVGAATAAELVGKLREAVKKERVTESEAARGLLKKMIADELGEGHGALAIDGATVILVVGVNGVGKTTAIGKMAHWYAKSGNRVLLAAADTFRAAAVEQLQVWGERAGVPVIAQQEGSDPAAVVFDAAHAAEARRCDVLISDTAGRLHNKKNLMNELSKMRQVIARELPHWKQEVLLVLDATTGQNALLQAKAFAESAELTGLIVTKLDGTAKGGMLLSIRRELGLPVRFIGVGEKIDDLQPFDAQAYVEALFA